MATSILLKFLTLKWNISGTIWRIEVGEGSFSCIFHALSVELNFLFDRRFPLRNSYKKLSGSTFRKICSKKCLYITKYSTKLIFSASQNLKTSEKAKQRLF